MVLSVRLDAVTAEVRAVLSDLGHDAEEGRHAMATGAQLEETKGMLLSEVRGGAARGRPPRACL